MKTIQINHLKKYYGKSKGIEDVSFEVEKGDFLDLLDPMGLENQRQFVLCWD